jgi:hypothetical protein
MILNMEESQDPHTLKLAPSPPIPRPRPASHFTETSNEQIQPQSATPALRPIPAPRQQPRNIFISQDELKNYVTFVLIDNSNMYYGAKKMFNPEPVPFIQNFTITNATLHLQRKIVNVWIRCGLFSQVLNF